MNRYLKSSIRAAPSVPSAKYQISCRFDGPLPVIRSSLVVAVEMHLVGRVAERLTLLQLLDDARITGGGDEGREPVEPGDDPVFDLAGGNLAGPAHDRGSAEAALHDRPLAPRERRLAAVGPREVLGAVVGREHDDGVFIGAHVLELLHDRADDVVELGHSGFVNRPAVLPACAASRISPRGG